MDRKSRVISLLYIGVGIGLILATFIFISWYFVYIDLASSDEAIGYYYEYAPEDMDIEPDIMSSSDAQTTTESVIIGNEDYNDNSTVDINRTGDL